MRKKFNIHDHIPALQEDEQCDRCDNYGVRQFEDGKLCFQCTINDVCEVTNDRED